MEAKHEREFRRLIIRILRRLYKVEGHLMWLGEKTMYGGTITAEDVDAHWDRIHMLEDELLRLRRSELWRSVDVQDEEDFADDDQ